MIVPAIVGGVVFLVMFGLFCKAVLAWERRQQSRWREQFEKDWPPISDEEFLSLCSPDTPPEIALGVRRIVAENLGVDYERVHPSMYFQEDLGAD